jgi:hypothetical protein
MGENTPGMLAEAWRERYAAAFALREREPARAAALFDALADEFKQDPVARRMADRLRAAGEAPKRA